MSPLRSCLLAVALAALAPSCWAAPTPQPRPDADLFASPLLDPSGPGLVPHAGAVDGLSGRDALHLLSQGQWNGACGVATGVLARQVADVDALGIFALCSAVRGDRQAATDSAARLRQVEPAPYFGPLTQGVLLLLDKQPAQAQAAWRPVLQTRPDDPLALYFEGEALHARKQSAQAVAAFRGSLRSWPDFAPALTATARLTSGPEATPQDLQAAVALAERATLIDQANRGYWRLLADLYRRTGQDGRADAITLQYLRAPSLPSR